MNAPEVSLLLCTRNRAAQLANCLGYIARIRSSRPWELVVVDNGSTDETAPILATFAAQAPTPVKLLYEGKPGKSRGLNQALQVSSGDIIAFIDDDCYVAPDHIDRVREAFADSKIGFAGGRVELFDPTDSPMTTKTSLERELLPPRSYVEGGWLLGANMMFRRNVLESIGGFDPDFGPGAPLGTAEDPEAQARASFAGWWGLYTPDVVVMHHHGRKAADIGVLWRKYSNGVGAYKLKGLLSGDKRRVFLRAWYWLLVGTLKGQYPLRMLGWEVEGAARYLAMQLRRYSISAKAKNARSTGSSSSRERKVRHQR